MMNLLLDQEAAIRNMLARASRETVARGEVCLGRLASMLSAVNRQSGVVRAASERSVRRELCVELGVD